MLNISIFETFYTSIHTAKLLNASSDVSVSISSACHFCMSWFFSAATGNELAALKLEVQQLVNHPGFPVDFQLN